MPQKYVAVEVKHCKAETASAVLFVLNDDREVWVPRSQLSEDDRETAWKGEAEFEIEITEWFANKEDIA